jgi:hypothetical protein
MEYKNILADFAERTLANLKQIRCLDAAQERDGVSAGERSTYPVTQLINSLLGLIVFPKENYGRHIPTKTLAELVQEGWPNLEITHPAPECSARRNTRGQRTESTDEDRPCPDHRNQRQKARCRRYHGGCDTLAELVRVLRNGVAHFNIEFVPNVGTHEIEFIEISNRCPCCNQITTTVRLDETQTGDIAERYARLMIENAGREVAEPSA